MAKNNNTAKRYTKRSRFTKRSLDGNYNALAPINEVINKLAAYEDTGLTPEDIASMMIATRQYSMINVGTLFKANGIDVDERIEELLNKLCSAFFASADFYSAATKQEKEIFLTSIRNNLDKPDVQAFLTFSKLMEAISNIEDFD
jgi:hypothetical protein